LPIHSSFDALGRTPQLTERIAELYSEMCIKLRKLCLSSERFPLSADLTKQLARKAEELLARIGPWILSSKVYVEWSVTRSIPWEEIEKQANDLSGVLSECISQLYDQKEAQTKEKTKDAHSSSSQFDWAIHRLHEFRNAVFGISAMAESDEVRLSNLPALLIVGSAGQGKTHLLCEVAKRDVKSSRPRLLLHGEQFQDGEPWAQIVRLLGLNCNRDELVGALEAAAQANNCRVLILIDAINEGPGNRLWKSFLPGMLTVLARSDYLCHSSQFVRRAHRPRNS
jgi:hypothetical protein